MPSIVSAVGPLTLPLPAGVAQSPIVDPTVAGLAAYLAHWLNAELNAKLANLVGTSAEAVPAGNIFLWDPARYFVRGRQDGDPSPLPALYVWRQGRSRAQDYSTCHKMREQTIGVSWIFEELVLPGSMEDRYGLTGAADAVFLKAADWRLHPTYSHGGGPVGQPIATSLSLSGWGARYDGAESVMTSPIPAVSEARGAGSDGAVLRAFPTLSGTWTVWERSEGRLPLLTDAQDDVLVTSSVTDGDPSDPLLFFEHYLQAPDAVPEGT